MMTKQIGIREAKTNLSRYLGMVKQGREIILTERGHPIGKIVPMRQDEIPLKNRIKKLEDAGILEPEKNIKNVASFTSTLHFLTPSSVFLGLSQKSVNYFYGDMKDAKNVTSPIPVKASKTTLKYLQEDRENR